MSTETSAEARQDESGAEVAIAVDLYRAFVFPNRMREHRRARGYAKLLRLSAQIPDIPYIRLSKIERGEVVPRPDELRRVAAALGLAPAELLIDIDAPGFDIAQWAAPFADGTPADVEEERFAVLLGAAVRARRTADPALTIAAIEREYGLPPVNLSRVENAQKPYDRWNAATQRALLRLLGVSNEAELRAHVTALARSRALDGFLGSIANSAARHERTRARIAEVAAALQIEPTAVPAAPALPSASSPAPVPLVPVFGGVLPQGLIADTPTGEKAEAPHSTGPRSFALKTGRATLGAGLPGQSVVIIDPDRFPTPGGIAALREQAGWRLLSVGSDRDGRMIGYSSNPPLEMPLDDRDPANLAAVVAALFP